MVKMFETGKISSSYCAEALQHYFLTFDYSDSDCSVIDSLLKIQNGRPYFHHHLFSRPMLSGSIAFHFMNLLPIGVIRRLLDALTHLDDSADNKDELPGDSLYCAPPKCTVQSFGHIVARPDYRRFILLDHIVQNFEEFEGIDLAIGVKEENIGIFNCVINAYVRNMTIEERAYFLEKTKNLPGCKLTMAIQEFVTKETRQNSESIRS